MLKIKLNLIFRRTERGSIKFKEIKWKNNSTGHSPWAWDQQTKCSADLKLRALQIK